MAGRWGNSRSWARRGARARQAEGSAGGGRSLKRKSRDSGKFWFSDPMVRPDPAFGPSIIRCHETPRIDHPLNRASLILADDFSLPGYLVLKHAHDYAIYSLYKSK